VRFCRLIFREEAPSVAEALGQSGRFLWVGNDLSIDFVNTTPVVDGRPVDLLDSFNDLVDWLAEGHALGEGDRRTILRRVGGPAGEALLDEAREFRTALRSLFEAVVAAAEPPAGPLAAINERLRRREVPEVRYEDGSFVRAAPHAGLDERSLLLPLAEAAADLLTKRDLSLLKRCENPACVLLYYDTTRNHARRWCSMAFCGNRHKVAAHYRRRQGK
jgi:predicted RNA-binding Zn ribbon-like protein